MFQAKLIELREVRRGAALGGGMTRNDTRGFISSSGTGYMDVLGV